MKQHKRRLCAGTTLVEMIVSFALVAVFMAAAVVMITATVRLYGRIRMDMIGQNVCDMILDRMESELRPANTENIVICDDNAQLLYENGGDTILFEKGEAVCCCNGSGRRVCMFALPQDAGAAAAGTFVIHYYAAGTQEASNWHYDAAAMQNYIVESLSFTRVSDTAVQITLTLHSALHDYTCTATRTVEATCLDKGGARVEENGVLWA